MTTEIYRIADEVTGDALRVDFDAGRLLFRSTADGRERVLIVASGVSEGRRLASALLAALESEAA